MALSQLYCGEPSAMRLEALRHLPYGITSSGFLQVEGETAPRQDRGKQAGGFPSTGRSSGFFWEKNENLFRCGGERGTNDQTALSPKDSPGSKRSAALKPYLMTLWMKAECPWLKRLTSLSPPSSLCVRRKGMRGAGGLLTA